MASKWTICALAVPLFLPATDTFARPLAVGAAGTGLYPVYVVSPARSAEIPDTTFGVFREPIYTTPRGYRYIYVRGYRIVPQVHRIHAVTAKKKFAVTAKSKRTKTAKRTTGCISDLGYGRYSYCN
jgi:hypothetical protein